jgi:hypothetical protein
MRLVLEHVEAGAGDRSVAQRLDKRLLVDDRAACDGPRTSLTSRGWPLASIVVSTTTTAWMSGGSRPL